MKVLLVEDEEHKARELRSRLLNRGIPPENLSTATGVSEAVLSVIRVNFDLVVLDIALPTFPKGGIDQSGGGVAQSLGGIEILRALKRIRRKTKVIIVTQYPDVVLSGETIKIGQMAKFLSKRYEQSVLGATLYSFSQSEWQEQFDGFLTRAICE